MTVFVEMPLAVQIVVAGLLVLATAILIRAWSL